MDRGWRVDTVSVWGGANGQTRLGKTPASEVEEATSIRAGIGSGSPPTVRGESHQEQEDHRLWSAGHGHREALDGCCS